MEGLQLENGNQLGMGEPSIHDYISRKFLITLCVGITFCNILFITFRAPCAVTFRENFLLRFVQVFTFAICFITLYISITFRNDFFIRFRAGILHFATYFYYIMRRYYISQRCRIPLCVGITFRNIYFIMRFNRRANQVGQPLSAHRDQEQHATFGQILQTKT